MGLRGRLPTLALHTEPLDDLQAPDYLQGEALLFWDKHIVTLTRNQLVTVQTADTFALCCELWGKLRNFQGATSRSYLDLVKAFQQIAKPFRLLPVDKPGSVVEYRGQNSPEFDF